MQAPEVLELLEPAHLLVVWSDGHEAVLAHRDLRLACPCANCVDEFTGEPLLDPAKVPDDIRVTGWTGTGNYGLSLTFSDGHATGIYTFEKLRSLG